VIAVTDANLDRSSTEPPGPALLELSPNDDVMVAVRDIAPGAHQASNGATIDVREVVALGHEDAARAIACGEPIVRDGMPIGSATMDIPQGAWVHTHNLESGYISTRAHRGGVA
jgi:hypothetical protein